MKKFLFIFLLNLIFIPLWATNPVDQPIQVEKSKNPPKTKHLAAIEVVAQGSQVHFDIDKKVFSVDRNIASSGGSITDVLKNIPSVDVDVEGNISLRNDNNVDVWINGKSAGLTSANRAQILEQLPAEDVESIEIITNPSAKYSATGTAGVINLVMKDNRKPGYYGSVSTGLTRAGRGKLGGLAGANFSYSNRNFDVYANAGYRDVSKEGYGWTDRFRFSGLDTTLLRKDNIKFHQTQSLFFRAGLDYHLDSKTTLGFSGFALLSDEKSDNNINYLKTRRLDNSVLKIYNRENLSSGMHPSIHLSLDLLHSFDKKGSFIKSSLTYTKHEKGGVNEFFQRDSFPKFKYSDISQNTINNVAHLEFKLDYTHQFSKSSKLEAGWNSKIQNSYLHSDGVNRISGDSLPGFFDIYNYVEQLHAGYADYSGKFNQFGYLVGIRGEYIQFYSTNKTSTGFQTNPVNQYFKLFPSLFLSYALPDKNELQLNYTRRINRPQSSELNPFHQYTDANDIDYGNPILQPEYATSLELNYLKYWENHSLSASAYYKNVNNIIENISFVSPFNADVMENTFINIGRSSKAGVELIAKDKLFKILDLTSAVNVYYNQIDSAIYSDPLSGIISNIRSQNNISWTGKIIANILLDNDLSAQLIGEYASPKIIPLGMRGPNYSIDLGLRKSFLDRNLIASLTVRDLLDSDRKYTQISGLGFYENAASIPHGRTFRFTLTYNFGNLKAKKRAELDKKLELPEIESNIDENE